MDLEESEFTVLQYLSALKADHLKKICQNPALNLNLTSNEFQSSIIEFHCRDLLPSVLSKFALSNDDELVAYRLTESGLNLSAGLLSFFEKIEEGHSNSNLRVTLIVLLSLMIVCTIVGNILVCLSVILVRKLRHPSNYLLVSLAISDLCVAVLVMPLALQYELTQSWKLSNAICDLWVSFDVTCCTSSILNLCTISIDRYLAITKPLTYGVRRTTTRILSFIVLVWIASCLISIPPVLIFGNEHGSMKQPRCEVSQNLGYQLYATLGAFYIPLLVMIVMYYKIYVAAKKVVDAELRDQRSIYSENDLMERDSQILTSKQRSSNALRERKASITLGIIMTAFTFCWLPFFILALLRPFSASVMQIPRYVNSIALWLGYVNSVG
ncbi:7 transmembrane receptor (rhodopsin family)-like protein 8 [Sarcoptes scabiei]|uniref:7 transmembrane receptor (Rhodopsin family)-like protein 8 n=1 Tax=Sarcoptes scabiei TaxID=52283 RepID=A0A132A5D8_SARSC|nr:7 transmembrane receptor (rhodopsin family)-like protein 8 [Sarcoptes scabiei]